MFPEPTELRFIGNCDKINLDPKIQIKYVDTKHRLADTLEQGHFTRDEWNHLRNLNSPSCSQAMSKRTQEGHGEERFAAKSRPLSNSVSRSMDRVFNSGEFDYTYKPWNSHVFGLIAGTEKPVAKD